MWRLNLSINSEKLLQPFQKKCIKMLTATEYAGMSDWHIFICWQCSGMPIDYDKLLKLLCFDCGFGNWMEKLSKHFSEALFFIFMCSVFNLVYNFMYIFNNCRQYKYDRIITVGKYFLYCFINGISYTWIKYFISFNVSFVQYVSNFLIFIRHLEVSVALTKIRLNWCNWCSRAS